MEAERAACGWLRRRRAELCHAAAPAALLERIGPRRPSQTTSRVSDRSVIVPSPRRTWSTPSLAVAATLLAVVASGLLYRATLGSTEAMAAELAVDHVKCFMANRVLQPHESIADIEADMRSRFDWEARLPASTDPEDLEVVGARPCLYEHGRVAHIMYHYQGVPVSIFMLPGVQYERQLLHTMGHDAVVWTQDRRTFVVVARAPRAQVEQVAARVRASLR